MTDKTKSKVSGDSVTVNFKLTKEFKFDEEIDYIFQYVCTGEHQWCEPKINVIDDNGNDMLHSINSYGEALQKGYALVMNVDDPDKGDDMDWSKEVLIKTDDVIRGLEKLPETSNYQFQQVLNEDPDFCTYDAILQTIIYGEVIYG